MPVGVLSDAGATATQANSITRTATVRPASLPVAARLACPVRLLPSPRDVVVAASNVVSGWAAGRCHDDGVTLKPCVGWRSASASRATVSSSDTATPFLLASADLGGGLRRAGASPSDSYRLWGWSGWDGVGDAPYWGGRSSSPGVEQGAAP